MLFQWCTSLLGKSTGNWCIICMLVMTHTQWYILVKKVRDYSFPPAGCLVHFYESNNAIHSSVPSVYPEIYMVQSIQGHFNGHTNLACWLSDYIDECLLLPYITTIRFLTAFQQWNPFVYTVCGSRHTLGSVDTEVIVCSYKVFRLISWLKLVPDTKFI